MDTSEALIKLTQLLAEAYAETVGPKGPQKGRKKLGPQDQQRLFDKLADHLAEVRLASMESQGAAATPSKRMPSAQAIMGDPGDVTECPGGMVWCVLPPPLRPHCMTEADCTRMGGKKGHNDHS